MIGLRHFRLFLILASFPTFLGFLTLGLSDHWVETQATHWLYDRVEDLPEADVALVLGCAKTLSTGRSNLYTSNIALKLLLKRLQRVMPLSHRERRQLNSQV